MAEFDVSGNWDAHQSNGFIVNFDIQQTGTMLRGVATHSGGSVRGTVEGSVHNNQFRVSVRWNNGTIGEYNGTFNSTGRITGMTFDGNHPGSQATWASFQTFSQHSAPSTVTIGFYLFFSIILLFVLLRRGKNWKSN